MIRQTVIIICALAMSGCATGPKVTTDYDKSADFARYRTYSWVYSSAPRGMNPLLYQRVKAAIDQTLAARGFTPASTADFAIGFTLGARDRVETTDFGPYAPYYPAYGGFRRAGWGFAYNQTQIQTVTDGTLAIDIYDAGTKKPVWFGQATQEVTQTSVDDKMINDAVQSVLARFPPTAEK